MIIRSKLIFPLAIMLFLTLVARTLFLETGCLTAAKSSNPAEAPVHFPKWSKEARIAGLYFEPGDAVADTYGKIDAAKSQNVSVILADCPLGWEYQALNDAGAFKANLNLMKKVNSYAHKRGLKVVWYLTGLEVTSEMPGRNPAKEHPDWPQVSIKGQTIAFDDIGSDQEHWLDKGNIDVWLSPDSPYEAFFASRVKSMTATGTDGFWLDTVYLQFAIGNHDNLWPSFDPYSIDKYRKRWGVDPPRKENWDDINWLRWISWRHERVKSFVVEMKKAAKRVNPKVVFFEENWDSDTAGSTNYANDPASYFDIGDVSTGHEVGTIDDRIDLGGTGMAKATKRQWQDFNTMMKFAKATDGAKPSWILTYGYKSPDAKRLAAIILSNGANYYETKGPGMAETVGSAYRKSIFSWIRANSGYIYNLSPVARVALLYSSVNRDFIDGGSGEPYDTADSTFFKRYRDASALLQSNHVPFDVLIEQNLSEARLARYQWLILPNISFLSARRAAIIKNFVSRGGKLVSLGENGAYDEWGRERQSLVSVKRKNIGSLISDQKVLFGKLPSGLMSNLRSGPGFYALHLVNLSGKAAGNLTVSVKLPAKCRSKALAISPDSPSRYLPVKKAGNGHTVKIPRLKIYTVLIFRK